METTKLSSKGQVILPKSVRAAHKWEAGVEFAVVDTKEGVLLKPLKLFKPKTIEEVFGCTGYQGPVKSLKDMEAAIVAEAKKHK